MRLLTVFCASVLTQQVSGVRVKVEDILNLSSALESEETVQDVLNSTPALESEDGLNSAPARESKDSQAKGTRQTLNLPEFIPPAGQLNLGAQVKEPVFIHATSKELVEKLVERGLYEPDSRKPKSQGLYTTPYIPNTRRAMREPGHIPGSYGNAERLRKGNLGNYRNYVTSPGGPLGLSPKQSFKKYARLVAFQVQPGHTANIAIAPRKVSMFSRDSKLPQSCQGFDAFALPLLEPLSLNKTTGQPQSCDTLPSMDGKALKDLSEGDECTALTQEQVFEAIYFNCLEEVKWNFGQLRGGGSGRVALRLPSFLNVVFVASNNPDTADTEVVSFLGASSQQEYEKRVCKTKAWSKSVFSRNAAWEKCG